MPTITSATLDSGGRLNPTSIPGILRSFLDTDEEDDLRDLQKALADQPVQKFIWSSPAGKKRIADQIVKMLPPHRVYVDAFVGSGAVLFAKEPAAVEVVNDLDPDIAGAFRTLKALDQSGLDRLKRQNWTGDRKRFLKLRDSEPTDPIDQLYRFLYVRRFSQMKMGRTYSGDDQGVESSALRRVEHWAPRVKRVRVYCQDYESVCRKYDFPDTIHFLDPPYVAYGEVLATHRAAAASQFDEDRFFKMIQDLKGKVLVTYGNRGQLPTMMKDLKDWRVTKIKTRRSAMFIQNPATRTAQKFLINLVFSNYDIPTSKAEDGFETETVKAAEVDRFLDEDPESGPQDDPGDETFSIRKRALEVGDEPRRGVLQLHFRGDSVHADLRYLVGPDVAIGWTLAVQRPGEVRGVETVGDAKAFGRQFDPKGSDALKPLDAPNSVVAVPKGQHDPSWLAREGEIDPGAPGGGEKTGGILIRLDTPDVQDGTSKPTMRELFLSGSKVGLSGRLVLGKTDQGVWLARLSKDLTPYVLSHDAVAAGEIPPAGRSGIPRSLEPQVPRALRYWEDPDETKRLQARDTLVESGFPDGLMVVDGQIKATVQKRFLQDPTDLAPLAPEPRQFLLAVQSWDDLPDQYWFVLTEPIRGARAWSFASQPFRGTRVLSLDSFGLNEETRTGSREDLERLIQDWAGASGQLVASAQPPKTTITTLDHGAARVIRQDDRRSVVVLDGSLVQGLQTIERPIARYGGTWFFAAGDAPALWTQEGVEIERVQPDQQVDPAAPSIQKSDKTVCVDFDGVLHSNPDFNGPANIDGDLLEAGVRTVQALREAGHRILIFSSRANDEAGREAIRKWLTDRDVPFDDVADPTQGKPAAVAYIDDRAVPARDPYTIDEILLAVQELAEARPWS